MLCRPILVLASMATAAFGAECYTQTGSKQCVNPNGAYAARETYCNGGLGYWENNRSYRFQDKGTGFSGLIASSEVPDKQACYDSLQNIISQCLGEANGGSYSIGTWNMNFNFCA